MSGTAGITGHVPRLLVKEAPTFLEEIKAVLKTYREQCGPDVPGFNNSARADDLIAKLDRMGVKDV